ncbi:class I SAM-dependent methyltransferase [Geomesophilobacter sediminis]|uniref:Class I SAM-dependent methyltransferase n=1 Tax=Geomesophilobacter sediminis TaxID=2798584 RepID=A0A8J7JF44_9BACT|nr:class I SAM-dependent methyltransferase [Geomesophilobacter sediminis]MBJ6724839.1 class I SAM-dependent methyltransferase [Geomesophilobacter sediminis]
MHSGEIICSKDDVRVIDCTVCGYRHLLPVPDKEFIASFYKKQYFVTTQDDYYEKQLADNDYLNFCFSEYLAEIGRHVGSGARSLLDIGCGSGLFLKYCHDAGWEVTGVEPSLSGISDFARQHGITIHEQEFDHRLFAGKRFSVVTLNNVLEHVIEPQSVCREIYDHLLEEGGILQVKVPNDFSPLQTMLQESRNFRPYWISHPDHINYFDRESLLRLVGKAGFTFIGGTVTFPLEMYLMMGLNYVEEPAVGKSIHSQRVNFEYVFRDAEKLDLKRDLYARFFELGIGRELIAYFKK